MASGGVSEAGPRVVELRDERESLAHAALELIAESIWDVQPARDLLSELEECRRGLPSGGDYHLLALLDGGEQPVAAAAGVYLDAVNAGFVTYLAVREAQRGRRLGRELRRHLVEAFRTEARRKGHGDLAWTVGEVRRESPWLRTLVREGRAVPFDFPYFHPWMPRRAENRYVLYREPLGDTRAEIPSEEVLRLVYGIWRRAYRIRFPTQSETFCYMLQQLEGRDTVGVHPDFSGDLFPGY
ncbi:MAG TPA: GNAT family N-acetyltransferase [Longimicrobiaceae bacterium]|nr:GNAT family N-acetyltransferase [Longimicrobiaceae bacterium]